MSFRCSVVLRGLPEGSFHVWSSLVGNKPTDLAQHRKARLFSPGAFKTSKYQNLPMYHFQKWLGFVIFCDFDTCHKEITIDSLVGSPCINFILIWPVNIQDLSGQIEINISAGKPTLVFGISFLCCPRNRWIRLDKCWFNIRMKCT